MGRQTSSGDRYTLISSDTHAGGSHAQYREFLDPRFREDFDAWRGRYRNPFSDLGDDRRLRNWDDEMRNSQQDRDGVHDAADEVGPPDPGPVREPPGEQ